MDVNKLKAKLPPSANLVIGNVKQTARAFLASLSSEAPIGFIAVDVDYYSSAKDALGILTGAAELYLPLVGVYLDDIATAESNPWRGELLACNEFNDENKMRKIAPFSFLRPNRVFKHSQWIDQMFAAHIAMIMGWARQIRYRDERLFLSID